MNSEQTRFPITNRQFLLRTYPVGMPKESDFALTESRLPPLAAGQIAACAVLLSVDPYVRRAIGGDTSYSESVPIGGLIPGLAVARVIASRNPTCVEGDYVLGEVGWQEYSVTDGSAWLRLDPNKNLSAKLGVLGMPGLTAYFGLLDICHPKPGETVVVSGAGGAIGSLVGQIAKIAGARAIGIAGSDEKVAWLLGEAGFDGALNYKSTNNVGAGLNELCPQGIDCYFDNVGGAISEAIWPLMNSFGRVAVCGLISQYNSDVQELPCATGPFNLILRKQLRVEGFNFARFQNRWREALTQLAEWVADGKLRHRETIVDGFTNTPRAFVGLMQGDNIGKMLVRV